MTDANVSKEEMIEYAAAWFRRKGFRKSHLRWRKSDGVFTKEFVIQGSSFSREAYYIRPCVHIDALADQSFGMFAADIPHFSTEQVIRDTERFFCEWTNPGLIRAHIQAFLEWDARNPLEVRRERKLAVEQKYTERDERNRALLELEFADPCPAPELFDCQRYIPYLLENL